MSAHNILLVEDDEAVLHVMTRVLELRGYRVSSTRRPREALTTMAEGLRPHLVISDVVMPGMSGMELAVQLRNGHPHLPILLVSGYAHDDTMRRSLGDAHIAFLDKPFSPDTLLRTVADLLRDDPPQPGLRRE